MSRLHLFALIIPFVTLTGAAHADEAEEEKKQELLKELGSFDNASFGFLTDGLNYGELYLKAPAARCTEIIGQLKALGVPPTENVFSRESFMLRKAPEKCARYAGLQLLGEAFPAIKEARSNANIVKDKKPGDAGTTMWSTEGVKTGKACVDALNAVEAKGAIMDVIIASPEPQLTGAQTRTFCEELIKASAALAGESKDADAAKKKKAHDRYAKAGARGDKLEWLVYYDPDGDGFTWYVPGCKATDDPRTLAKAKALTQLWENADGSWRVRKLTFKGHKKAKDVEREFDKKSDAYKFCK